MFLNNDSLIYDSEEYTKLPFLINNDELKTMGRIKTPLTQMMNERKTGGSQI